MITSVVTKPRGESGWATVKIINKYCAVESTYLKRYVLELDVTSRWVTHDDPQRNESSYASGSQLFASESRISTRRQIAGAR